ncbi:KN motif and ankyrin repeat domain-containing protein 2 [Trichinella zimbabwensis]|uniref:KN motif and ankyrin repeat domain-containing protein 2 n=1 Tax=Trichinella zimbabwensis TaxID=268475 RepID=A0A0V1H1L5_9BILA|nr:KN motif and ankyrin repeat domain-containing protein 2 [Trichinella zimbabwensis]
MNSCTGDLWKPTGHQRSMSTKKSNTNLLLSNFSGEPKMTQCCCCPYGYHIDLDFVKYAENVNSNRQLSQCSNTCESGLGEEESCKKSGKCSASTKLLNRRNSKIIRNIGKPVSQALCTLRKDDHSPNYFRHVDPVVSSFDSLSKNDDHQHRNASISTCMFSDSLENVMSDFEETLSRSSGTFPRDKQIEDCSSNLDTDQRLPNFRTVASKASSSRTTGCTSDCGYYSTLNILSNQSMPDNKQNLRPNNSNDTSAIYDSSFESGSSDLQTHLKKFSAARGASDVGDGCTISSNKSFLPHITGQLAENLENLANAFLSSTTGQCLSNDFSSDSDEHSQQNVSTSNSKTLNGISDLLQAIRHQMNLSVNHIQHLENQVKLIPQLNFQILTLKKEREELSRALEAAERRFLQRNYSCSVESAKNASAFVGLKKYETSAENCSSFVKMQPNCTDSRGKASAKQDCSFATKANRAVCEKQITMQPTSNNCSSSSSDIKPALFEHKRKLLDIASFPSVRRSSSDFNTAISSRRARFGRDEDYASDSELAIGDGFLNRFASLRRSRQLLAYSSSRMKSPCFETTIFQQKRQHQFANNSSLSKKPTSAQSTDVHLLSHNNVDVQRNKLHSSLDKMPNGCSLFEQRQNRSDSKNAQFEPRSSGVDDHPLKRSPDANIQSGTSIRRRCISYRPLGLITAERKMTVDVATNVDIRRHVDQSTSCSPGISFTSNAGTQTGDYVCQQCIASVKTKVICASVQTQKTHCEVCEARKSLKYLSLGVSTDDVPRSEVAILTDKKIVESKATNTENPLRCAVQVNTDSLQLESSEFQVDSKIILNSGFWKHASVNTEIKPRMSIGINTQPFQDQVKVLFDATTNTEAVDKESKGVTAEPKTENQEISAVVVCCSSSVGTETNDLVVKEEVAVNTGCSLFTTKSAASGTDKLTSNSVATSTDLVKIIANNQTMSVGCNTLQSEVKNVICSTDSPSTTECGVLAAVMSDDAAVMAVKNRKTVSTSTDMDQLARLEGTSASAVHLCKDDFETSSSEISKMKVNETNYSTLSSMNCLCTFYLHIIYILYDWCIQYKSEFRSANIKNNPKATTDNVKSFCDCCNEKSRPCFENKLDSKRTSLEDCLDKYSDKRCMTKLDEVSFDEKESEKSNHSDSSDELNSAPSSETYTDEDMGFFNDSLPCFDDNEPEKMNTKRRFDFTKPRPTRAFNLSKAAAAKKLLTSRTENQTRKCQPNTSASRFQRSALQSKSLRVDSKNKGDHLAFFTDKRAAESKKSANSNKSPSVVKEEEEEDGLSKKVPIKKINADKKSMKRLPARPVNSKFKNWNAAKLNSDTNAQTTAATNEEQYIERVEEVDTVGPLPSEILSSVRLKTQGNFQNHVIADLKIHDLACSTEKLSERENPPLSSDKESSATESDSSFDEGSYDISGVISHQCDITQNAMSGQATSASSLPDKLIEALQLLNDAINRAKTVRSERLAVTEHYVEQSWLKAAARKAADAAYVEMFLFTVKFLSTKLLKHLVNICDQNENTALHYAVSYGNFEVVSLLLDSQVCDLNKANKAGYTAVMLAALTPLRSDRDRMVLQRLFHMGNVNVKATQHGQTALMLAVSQNKLESVKLLLEAGANVNLQDEDGSTALMCAAEHGHKDIVRLLLDVPEIDASMVDQDGSTALSVAIDNGHKNIGMLIYAHLNYGRKSNQPFDSQA